MSGAPKVSSASAAAAAPKTKDANSSNAFFGIKNLLKISSMILLAMWVRSRLLTDPHPEDAQLLFKNPSYCGDILRGSVAFNISAAATSNENANSNYSLTENSFECFFSDDYFTARKIFLDSLKLVKGSRHQSYEIHKDLTMDVGVIPGSKDNKKTILHISGTHGTEGYAGSAAQSAILAHLSSTASEIDADKGGDIERPNIVFVHALNPYGFAHNRRVNEENVDLNRNFLSESQWSMVKSRDPDFAGYVSADYVINPKSFVSSIPLINDLHGYLMMGYAATVLGMVNLKKALVSGNYFKKEGLGFGGVGLTKSARSLISLVQSLDEIKSAEDIVLVDVHTGLGPKGVDTLGTSSSVADIDKYFKTEYFNNDPERPLGGLVTLMKAAASDSALSGYELTVGTVTEDFCEFFLSPHLSDSNKLCITQEFGTIPMIAVGKSLVDENCAFQNSDDISAALKAKYTNKLRSSFYVDDSLFWKRNVVRRGLMVFNEGVLFLSRERESGAPRSK